MFPQIDPSKLDPKAVAELTALMQSLPYDKLMKMQSLMHNAMAGFDTKAEMEAFERELPQDFRARLMDILFRHGQSFSAAMQPTGEVAAAPATVKSDPAELSPREARLTILRAVADGKMTPEEAETLL